MQERRREVRDERSLGELFGDLVRDMTTLVRQELALARSELTGTASRVGKNIGFLAMGGAVAYAGFLAVVAAVIIALGQLGLPWWLAALLVGLVVGGVGYALIRRGLTALRQEDFAPRQTLETLQEDVHMVKEQVR